MELVIIGGRNRRQILSKIWHFSRMKPKRANKEIIGIKRQIKDRKIRRNGRLKRLLSSRRVWYHRKSIRNQTSLNMFSRAGPNSKKVLFSHLASTRLAKMWLIDQLIERMSNKVLSRLKLSFHHGARSPMKRKKLIWMFGMLLGCAVWIQSSTLMRWTGNGTLQWPIVMISCARKV